MEPKYRILELSTTGWEDWDKTAPSMLKEDCQELFQELVGDGISPNYLKIVRVA
mgnify:CR=1 FL=1|tara:strand:- start:1645 stop:1806 length:162 start_codon:yes stop_codon:yes gene_type:complete